MKKSSILNQFNKLSYSQQQELLEQLKQTLSENRPILNHKKIEKSCIHCGSNFVYKHGKYKNGGTRFHCQDCKKSYNELTGTSIHCIKKKELWDRFIGLMLDSKSIRHISKELGISTKTVFGWRHKVLCSFDELFTKEFKGFVETDSVLFRFDQKGIKKDKRKKVGRKMRGVSNQKVNVLFTMDRYKTYDFKLVKFGKLTIKSVRDVISKDRFNKGNVICSDQDNSLIRVFKEMGMEHHTFKSGLGDHGSGLYHVNTLNNTVGSMKKWMSYNFHSVSTKYLGHYLNWFSVLQILKDKNKKEDLFWNYLLHDNNTFERNKGIDDRYNQLLLGFK